MDEKNTDSTEGTEEIIASDGTPEVIDVESTTETAEAAVTETATQEVTATDGAQEEVAVTATEPVVVEATATTVTVQDAPEAGQPPAPEAATGAPVPPPPPTGAAGSAAPSATGALVCGILAIVLSGFPIFGVILGIVAIVLAGKYFKAGGTQGTGKAARICGIVGIVLAVVWFIAGVVLSIMALNIADDYTSTSPSSSSALSSSAAMSADESEAAVEAVTMRLQQIKDRDPEMIASIAAMADESFEDEFGYLTNDATMSECGIDPNEYMDYMLKDFDYEFMAFDMGSTSSSTKGTATFVLTSMDMIQLISNINDGITDVNDEGGFGPSDAQSRQQVGDIMMSALRNSGVSHYNFFEVKMVNQDGVWVIDEDSWNDQIETYFTLS